jgi:hypothetical protein
VRRWRRFARIALIDKGLRVSEIFLRNLCFGVDVPTRVGYIEPMTNNNNNTATALYNLIADMADERRTFAAANGFSATDDEIADSIKASLIRMMSN